MRCLHDWLATAALIAVMVLMGLGLHTAHDSLAGPRYPLLEPGDGATFDEVALLRDPKLAAEATRSSVEYQRRYGMDPNEARVERTARLDSPTAP